MKPKKSAFLFFETKIIINPNIAAIGVNICVNTKDEKITSIREFLLMLSEYETMSKNNNK